MADALGAYEHFLQEHHHYREAKQVQIRVIQLRQNSGLEPNANRDVTEHVNLVNIYMDAGQFDRANKVFDQARVELETSPGAGSSGA